MELINTAREWFHEHWHQGANMCGFPGETEEQYAVERAAFEELQHEKYRRVA